MSPLFQAIVMVIALGLIGTGVWLIRPALCPLVIGGLLWVDLTLGALRK